MGIGCSHPYFCAPKPSDYTIDDASWSGLTIHSAAQDAKYKVCYNKGMTFDRYQWYEVPGRVEVRKATFTWYTEPKMIGRKTPGFKLGVKRPFAFDTDDFAAAASSATEWRVKLIRSYFDCATVAINPRIPFNLETLEGGRSCVPYDGY